MIKKILQNEQRDHTNHLNMKTNLDTVKHLLCKITVGIVNNYTVFLKGCNFEFGICSYEGDVRLRGDILYWRDVLWKGRFERRSMKHFILVPQDHYWVNERNILILNNRILQNG